MSLPGLKRELPAYLSKCAGMAYDHEDVDKFTTDVLCFWANHGKEFPTWALAMQANVAVMVPAQL